MAVEIALIQRYILFLGHPVYATSVVLLALLSSGGAGSALAGRIVRGGRRAHLATLALTVALIALQVVLLPRLFAAWQDLGRPSRILLAVALLVPQGLVMGMQLPLGLRRVVDEGDEALTAWLWSTTGAASVLASVGTMVLAIWRGYDFCLWTGAAAYALCLVYAAAAPPPAADAPGSRGVTGG